jgi:excisionase family DNA binding protein
MTNPLLVSIDSAAERLAIHRSLMYLLIQRKEIASLKIGRARRIELAELERYVQSRREETESVVPLTRQREAMP